MRVVNFLRLKSASYRFRDAFSLILKIAICLTIVIMPLSNLFAKDVYIGGFASNGYIKTTENQYLVPKSIKGSPEFFEAAVNFMYKPSNKLRIGAQIYGRDLGDDGNFEAAIDWAYGDYRVKDYFGVRMGLLKIPLGLFNQYRDVDMARTVAILPQSLYGETDRDYRLAVEGSSLYGTIMLPGWGDLEYEGYYGVSSHKDQDKGFTKNVNGIFAMMESWNVADDISTSTGNSYVVASNTYKDAFHRWDYQCGGVLKWNTPLSGLTVGGSYYAYSINFGMDLDIILVDVATGNNVNTTGNINGFTRQDISNLFAQYSWNRLKFTFEHSDLKNHLEYNNNTPTKSIAESWYTMLEGRVSNKLSLATYYDVYYGNKFNREGDPPDEHTAWQKHTVFSARYNFTPNWLVKGDYHLINGKTSIDFNAPAPEEKWSMIVIKNTFFF